MAGSQQHPRVHRGVVAGAAAFWVGVILIAWGVGAFVAHRRPGAGLGLPPAPAGTAPRYGYLEQGLLSAPAPDEELRLDQRRLHGYEWADPQHRFARIPIERAEQLLLQQRGGR